jgi:hypothetical protein
MNASYYVLPLLCLFFVSTSQDETIKWTKDRNLKWSDFENTLQKDSPVAALSWIGITYSAPITLNPERCFLEIYAGFDKKKSRIWKEKTNDHILSHEQGHFNLAEIYARKMRCYLTSNPYKIYYSDFESDLNIILKAYEDSLEIVSDKYDFETDHSQEIKKQSEWSIKIKNELKELNKYNNTYVTILFKP